MRNTPIFKFYTKDSWFEEATEKDPEEADVKVVDAATVAATTAELLTIPGGGTLEQVDLTQINRVFAGPRPKVKTFQEDLDQLYWYDASNMVEISHIVGVLRDHRLSSSGFSFADFWNKIEDISVERTTILIKAYSQFENAGTVGNISYINNLGEFVVEQAKDYRVFEYLLTVPTGMTWAQFIDSPLNTDNNGPKFYLNAYDQVCWHNTTGVQTWWTANESRGQAIITGDEVMGASGTVDVYNTQNLYARSMDDDAEIILPCTLGETEVSVLQDTSFVTKYAFVAKEDATYKITGNSANAYLGHELITNDVTEWPDSNEFIFSLKADSSLILCCSTFDWNKDNYTITIEKIGAYDEAYDKTIVIESEYSDYNDDNLGIVVDDSVQYDEYATDSTNINNDLVDDLTNND